MSHPPKRPKIYHITHVDNLRSISRSCVLLSDAETIRQNLTHQKVGMSAIKARRLNELTVSPNPTITYVFQAASLSFSSILWINTRAAWATEKRITEYP